MNERDGQHSLEERGDQHQFNFHRWKGTVLQNERWSSECGEAKASTDASGHLIESQSHEHKLAWFRSRVVGFSRETAAQNVKRFIYIKARDV